MSTRFKLFLITAALAGGGIYASLPALGKMDLASISPAAGIAGQEIALHKALYSLNMISVASGAGVVGIRGSMYYEQDDACDAWASDQRFTMEYQYPERRPVNNTNHYITWESKDGGHFEFNSEREENGNPTEFLRGNVVRGEATQAKYTRPADLKFDLPNGYLLPTQHTNEVIRHARAGDKFFGAIMFDGTDSDGPVEIDTAIGKKVTPEEIKKLLAPNAGKIDMSLLTPDAWRVRMAVFPLKDKDEMTPAYEMDLILHDNGVVSYALVNYKTFKVEQRLKTMERLPPPKC